MRQLTFIEKGRFEWWDVPAPTLQAGTDAIVQPIAVARCDLDLYIATGISPMPGPFAFGHEAVAVVVDVGDAVRDICPGDKVVVPFQISCGDCDPCRRGHTNACTTVPFRSAFGLAPLSGTDHGGALADLMRVPFADHMLLPLPEGASPVAAAGVADNVTDGYRGVAEPLRRFPNAPVLVVGGLAQSVGLYAVQAAIGLGSSRVAYADWDAARLAIARDLGAEVAQFAPGSETKPVGSFQITVEASGLPDGLLLAIASTAPCGVCTVVASAPGSQPVIPLPQMYGQGIELQIGRAQARATMPEVLEHLACGHLHPEALVTRRVPFAEAAEAMTDSAVKLVFEHA